MAIINPYLTFSGNCEEAFNFYKTVFKTEIQFAGKFKDMPENPDYPVAEEDKEKIMHVSLPISKETTLMGSDSSKAFGQSTLQGNNFSISVSCDTNEEVDQIFNELADGGIIKFPLEKTFWESYFGMLTDKFGIHWMVSCETAEHKDYDKNNRKDEI